MTSEFIKCVIFSPSVRLLENIDQGFGEGTHDVFLGENCIISDVIWTSFYPRIFELLSGLSLFLSLSLSLCLSLCVCGWSFRSQLALRGNYGYTKSDLWGIRTMLDKAGWNIYAVLSHWDMYQILSMRVNKTLCCCGIRSIQW